MLHALNNLASQQTKGNDKTMEAMEHFLDYCATHPNATVRFQGSDMFLKINSDVSHLSEPETRSQQQEILKRVNFEKKILELLVLNGEFYEYYQIPQN